MVRTIRMNAQLFYQGAILSYIAMFYWLRPSVYLATKVIGPVWQIMFFTYLGTYATGQSNADFYIIGNAMQLVALSGVYGVTMSISGDRANGTLAYLFASPANRMLMFMGRAVFHVLDGMVGVVIGLAWGVLLLGLDLGATDPLALALIILVTAFSTSGLGLLMGSISLITVNVWFINNLIYYLMLLFCGVNIPLDNLPGWVTIISEALPLTRGIEAAREVIAGASLADVLSLVTAEFGIGAFYALLGYGIFRWIEMQAKRKATLDAI
jgi:ABC-2 type transport system permease protein